MRKELRSCLLGWHVNRSFSSKYVIVAFILVVGLCDKS